MLRALLTVAVLCLLLPAGARAQAPQTNAPPGNSAIDEYLETVPSATGNARPRPAQEGAPGVLSARERARLEALGADGRTLANAIDATAPAPATATGTRPKPEIEIAGSDGRSPLRAVLRTVGDGDGGMGLLLPAILLASLLAALAIVLRRRREAS